MSTLCQVRLFRRGESADATTPLAEQRIDPQGGACEHYVGIISGPWLIEILQNSKRTSRALLRF
jgi:hypothetical protein